MINTGLALTILTTPWVVVAVLITATLTALLFMDLPDARAMAEQPREGRSR